MRPFRIDVPQADLDDLHDRLARTRWPAQLPGGGWTRGVPVGYLRDLATYWRTRYDWRVHEAALNELGRFATDIGGQTVHFVHMRSAARDAVPLLITHSWPGSVVELMRVLGPLSESFHVVAPSIPGFGFSGPPRHAGWTLARVAGMWLERMSELGYERFGVHGNDACALISPEVARLAPDRVLGVHMSGGLGIPMSDADFAELTEADLAGFAGMREMMATARSCARPCRKPARRPSPTAGTTRRSRSWRGSWRSSATGRTPPRSCRRTPWTVTSCSPTSRCTG